MEKGRKAVHLFVAGRVQGVGFRWFAKKAADKSGVDGFVRNLADGRVEAWAEGDADAVESFVSEVCAGPSFAVVTDAERYDVAPKNNFKGFNVTY